ncbi:MAG: hypothetical protein WCR42_00535 [bacterium]
MKNIKKIMLLGLVLTIFAVNEMKAQDEITEPCLPDCIGDTWSPAFPEPANSIELFICSQWGHTYTAVVYYRTRLACNMYYDYYIEFIGLTDGLPACYTQNNLTWAQMINQIILLFIAANPGNYPPLMSGDPCEENWRIMKGSCWFYRSPGGVGGGIIAPLTETEHLHYPFDSHFVPCTTAQCCLEYFTVCIVNNVRTITNTGYQEPEDCGENVPYNCQPTCGTIYR